MLKIVVSETPPGLSGEGRLEEPSLLGKLLIRPLVLEAAGFINRPMGASSESANFRRHFGHLSRQEDGMSLTIDELSPKVMLSKEVSQALST